MCGVKYEVIAESGKVYSLNNDFMCPNERMFGKIYGDFLSREKRISKHIGQIGSRSMIDRVYAVGSDICELRRVKEEFGWSRYDEGLEKSFVKYMTRFFENYNAGKPKRIFPRLLKAPGGQLFYWDQLPRFKGQERVRELNAYYTEQYFDGDRIHRITKDLVKNISFEIGAEGG